MDISLLIARRLSLKRDDDSAGGQQRSPAVVIAVAGISLSITIMLLTLAIVPGFKHQITQKVFGFDAQVILHPVQPAYDQAEVLTVKFTDSLQSRLYVDLPLEAKIDLTVSTPGIIKTDNQFAGLVFKGYSNGLVGTIVSDNLEGGSIPEYSTDSVKYDIVISRITADALDIDIEDKVNAYFFVNGNLKTRRFKISGIYNSHFGEYDKLMAYASIDALRSIASVADDEGSQIEITGLMPDQITDTRVAMQRVAGEMFYDNTSNCYLTVSDVYEKDPMYFNWLDLLDTNVVVILILMASVAAVTLISCLVIMILERVTLIGTLKSLGASNGMIERIFLFMAQRVVVRGIILGDVIGLVLVWLQWQFKIVPLDPEAYYLNSVPVEFNWVGIVILNLVALLLSMAILLIPTRMVARISPARVMRFE